MIADKSYGLIFLPNDCAHGLLEHAHAHADVRIELSDHPDARIDPRTSDPIGPTVGMSAFLLPKTGDATRIIPTQVHEVWRTRLPVYQTPLRLEAWTDALKWHPDIEFVHDVIDGIEFGRAMGFRGDRFLQRDCTNPPAHQVHQPMLREIRETELRNGWRAGPFPCRDTPPLFNLMAHPTKAVFKKFSTKIRHVVNISYPHDPSSVNRNIERLTRLANVSFEQAASIVAELGAGTLLYKFDIVSAYKLVASLPQDWHLQGELEMIDGVKHYSFATTTCFGAASSADVFHDLGSAAEFILRCATGNVVIVRYADDFLVLIPPLDSSPAHAQAMAARDRIIDVCDALGLPIAKFEGPAPSLVFVGTGIDSTLMRAFIPPERVAFTIELLHTWMHKKVAREREIQSLAGQLSFASRVVRWGRPHIADLFALASRGRARHVRLPPALRVSLRWWLAALAASPWCSLREFAPFAPTVTVETDASSTGIGAYSPTSGHWFSHTLTKVELKSAHRAKARCMGELELRGVAMAITTFAHTWAGCMILCITDNAEADIALNKKSSRMPKMRHLINFIGLIAHEHHLIIQSRCVKRDLNWRADLLSKHQAQRFLDRTPAARPSGTTPRSVPTLLSQPQSRPP